MFTVIVDPRRSSNKPGQEANNGTQTAGNRPNLQYKKKTSESDHPSDAKTDQEELNYLTHKHIFYPLV